ncbi:MAG: aldo/keto reductase, partial [Geobacter sp.]|nr:aldo/keto reductase [Geobacter sp.]
MREIILPGTDITTTVMGYGCGGLMRSTSRHLRSALLNEAYDNGIRHFDVARMYGLGAAEAELGKFIKGKRDGLVVASKFGIEVAAQHWALVAMQGVARQVIALSPTLRRLARRKAGALYQPRKYDVETAKKSLHDSLKALGTDYLDIFFLHEPSLADLTDP